MADRQLPDATHQSWTGSVAVYLSKPQRAALYPGQSGPSAAGGAGAANPASAAIPLAVGAESQAPNPDFSAAQPPSVAPLRPQPQLPSAPNKAALRGTWVVSRGSATMTAALSAAGQGEFTVKVQLESNTLWLQDLFGGGGEVRLLAPVFAPPPPHHQQQQQQQPWLLLLLPPRTVQTEGAAAAVATAVELADAATAAPPPQRQLPAPGSKPQFTARTLIAPSGTAAVAAAPAPGGARGRAASGGDVPHPLPAQTVASPPPGTPPPPLCFRFNSAGEGRAFQSLLEAAERVRGGVLQRAGERQREQKQRRAEDAEAAAAAARLKPQLQAQAAGGEGQAGYVGGDHWSDADIRAAIERYLLEPGFQALVERVEAVWEEMEKRAERQLQAAAEAWAPAAAAVGQKRAEGRAGSAAAAGRSGAEGDEGTG